LLRFFKTNAPFQFFSLLFLFLLFRLPQFLYGIPLLQPEFKLMLTGEQLAAGHLLYVDVIDDIGPFSGLVYAFMHILAPRSGVAYQIAAALICLFQMYYLTALAHKKQFFIERNYVVGLVLCLFFNISFDFYTLSPALLGNTFLLLAFGKLVKQIDTISDDIFRLGLYLGIAVLYFGPLLFFVFWALVVVNLYTGARMRQQFLLLLGFALPISFVAIWYYVNGHSMAFQSNFITPIISQRQFIFNDFSAFLSVYALPVGVAVLGFMVALTASRFSNFQTRVQQIVLLWLLSGLACSILIPYFAPHQYIFMVYPLAHLVVIFFNSFKKNWLAEIQFLVLAIVILYINFQAFVPNLKNNYWANLDKLKLTNNNTFTSIKNKKVLVLGNDLSPYIHNKTATPYVNWSLASRQFNQLNNYENIVAIMKNIETDKPEYIFDLENRMPGVFTVLPHLSLKYLPSTGHIYVLKN
jgi:hypothetical protein